MKRLVCLAALVAAGCATASKDIVASYVSPVQYNSLTCEQLAAEGARIQGRVTQLGGVLDKKATNDKAIVAVSAVLFWPAIFFVGGTKEQEAEYGRLKGQYEAVQGASVEKNCGSTTTASTGASALQSAVLPVPESAPTPSETF